jgi:type IV secretory pathway VirJ component
MYQLKFNRKKIILIGYSFGGDVMPFVYNLLPAVVSAQVVNINLLSPSPYTDFEIHVLGMMGVGSSGGKSVVAAINKISTKPITLLFGDDENDFPVNQLVIKNYVNVRLEGGHHYDGDEAKVCNSILLHLPK